jgi:hypothetical protein
MTLIHTASKTQRLSNLTGQPKRQETAWDPSASKGHELTSCYFEFGLRNAQWPLCSAP